MKKSNPKFDLFWSIEGLVLQPTVREQTGLSCVQKRSNTEKTVSSKVKTIKTDNDYESNEYFRLSVYRGYTLKM